MSRFDPSTMTLSPPHRKKVIYIDQFAISDMMKAVDAKARAHKRAESYWLRLFEALERVCKLQLAVCPSSPIHREESLLSDSFASLERMYEQLSNGVRFQPPDEIEQRQTDTALVAWLYGRVADHQLDPERVTYGGLHDWQARYLVTVSMKNADQMVRAIRRERSKLSESLATWFEECRRRDDKTFDHAIGIESDGCRDGLVHAYNAWVNRQLDLATGRMPFTPENVSPSPAALQVIAILEVLKERGIDQQDSLRMVVEFLNSSQFRDTPSNEISTRLFASIAHAAANGRKQPPDEGTSNDIRVVAAYMLYCDAMLVDNRVRAMLTSLPKRYALDYPCRVFSRNNGNDFLAYLQDIEREADPFIVALVRDVYGEGWPKPFLEMYEVERRLQRTRAAN